MTPEEGTKQAQDLKALFVEAFNPTQCFDNMDDLVGELNDEDDPRPKDYCEVTSDYFYLKAVQDALKNLDDGWLYSILDELVEAYPKFK